MTNGTPCTKYLLKSGNTTLPMPSKYQNVPNEILSQKSGRMLNGMMVKIRVAIKQTISVEWNVLTKAEKNDIITATSANTFSLMYYNTETDTYSTGTFYRGSDYTVEPIITVKTASSSGSTSGQVTEFRSYTIKMTLIEV